MTVLIALSSLRWTHAYQRTQHLLSRLAHRHRVIHVEAPVFEAGAVPHFEYRTPCDNVLSLRPVSPVDAPGFHPSQLQVLKPLLRQLLEDEGLDDTIAWCCTPEAGPLLDTLRPRQVVYDCTDDAPLAGDAVRRHLEDTLLARADLVVADCPTRHDRLAARHPRVQCLPGAGDAALYTPERITQDHKEYLAAEKLQAHILAPRIGYCGPVDEQVDLELVDGLSRRHPDWHFVFAGPVVGIDALELPRRRNLHWLGEQAPSRLPAVVAGWDVCMLPFADDAEGLDPALALVALAAQKPVVATLAPDIARVHGAALQAADGLADFAAACEAALRETPDERGERQARAALALALGSWDEAARTALRWLDGLPPAQGLSISALVAPAGLAGAPQGGYPARPGNPYALGSPL